MHHDLTSPDKVITSAELREKGVSTHAMAARCRPSGPWQRILPGVVLMTSSRPTRRQRLLAAVAYAGPEAIVTGADAMRAHGVDVPTPPDVLVLVPATRRLSSRSYLTVERTTRPPQPVARANLPYAPLARATLDAARRAADHDHQRTLLTAAVGLCTVPELRTELDAGSQRGSAAVRALLKADLTNEHEVVPTTLGQARRLLRATPLPQPRWHHPIHDDTDMLLGVPDAWWEQAALAWDVGEQARHHDPRTWAAAGVTLIRTSTERLTTDPTGVANELTTAFRAATSKQHRAS
jgi:hypothetical protein